MIAERARYHSTSSLGSGGPPEPASCYSELVRYTGHLWRRAKRKAKAYYTELQEQRIKEQLLKRTAQGYYGKEPDSKEDFNNHRPSGAAAGLRTPPSGMSCERHPENASQEGSLALVPFDYTRRVLLVQQQTTPRLDNKSSGRSSSVSFADDVSGAHVAAAATVAARKTSQPPENEAESSLESNDVQGSVGGPGGGVQSESSSSGVNNATSGNRPAAKLDSGKCRCSFSYCVSRRRVFRPPILNKK